MHGNRNNTSFPAKLAEYMRELSLTPEYPFLKYYQNLTRGFFSGAKIGTRGLLVQYEMGLGKSILAVAAAIDRMNDRQPIMLMAKSLSDNMRESIHKYVGMRAKSEPDWPIGRISGAELDAWIESNFSFVSMNAGNMLRQMGDAAMSGLLEQQLESIIALENLDGKFLIVDEAHNWFRAIVNGSKNARGLYDIVMKSKNLDLMFLTGTPIANDPFELVPCFNMLAGETILPEDYTEFRRLYVEDDGRIRNREKFQNRLFGLVSSQKHVWLDGNKGEFPERLPIVTVRVPMTPAQYVEYQLAREKERDEGSGGRKGPSARVALTKPKSKSSSSYRVKSRQLSNYYEGESSPKIDAIIANIGKHASPGLVYSQFTGAGGLTPFIRALIASGWKEYIVRVGGGGSASGVSGIGDVNYGPALPSVLDYLGGLLGGDRDTDYINDAGAAGMSLIEESVNVGMSGSTPIYTPADINGGDATAVDPNRKIFALISGDVPIEARIAIARAYNLREIDLLIISSTGAEGLDLKRTRHIHIMEPYWNWGRIEQIISRGVRNDSHIDLDASEKNVASYIYLSVPPDPRDTTITTDVELYEDALKTRIGNSSFVDAIDEISIECTLGGNRVCRHCSPTDEPLYSSDPAKDIRVRDPCVPIQDAIIDVYEIEIDGEQIQYSKAPDSAYGIIVYRVDPSLGAHIAVRESDPIYPRVYKKINEENE